ncbi:MAG: PPC domain-containing protein, partial [Sulfurovum sp.]|nr:PPC domain-containing protein [Sulfurovum sp.]
ITSDDDSGSEYNFKISQWLETGTYYVKVKHRDPSAISGTYLLAAHFDDYGDTPDDATPINPSTVASTVSGSIEMAGDEDWFKVDITSTGTLVIGIAGQTADDINVSLYGESNVSIVSGDSSNTLGVSKRLTAGTYYIKVKHHSATGTGNYRLATRFTPSSTTSGVPSGETTDDNNIIDDAIPVGSNSTTSGRINSAGDVDWFKIVIPRAGTFTVETSGTTDTYGVLYDANGTEITSDDDSGSDHNFKISRSITVGTYYVTVRHRDSSVTGGTYLLVAHFDDHGNSKDGATPISPSDTTSGSIETAGDVDWFKIVTTGPGVLAIGVTSQTAGDISVSLYNASSSTPIASGD